MTDAEPILELAHLSVRAGARALLEGVCLELRPRERLALIGPSGAGKTQLLRALMGLSGNATVTGRVAFAGTDLVTAPEAVRGSLRGRRIGFIPQNAGASLAPHRRVGDQFREVLDPTTTRDRIAADAAIDAALDRVGLADGARVRAAYPWQLSGGEAQRVVIAMALARQPAVLLADEPSSALDPLQAREVLDLLSTHDGALVLVAHDLGMLEGRVDTLAVMHAGRLIEIGPWATVTRSPQHPYTAALLRLSLGSRTPPKVRIEVADFGRAETPGCPLRMGCPRATGVCASEPPQGTVRCWHPSGAEGFLNV